MQKTKTTKKRKAWCFLNAPVKEHKMSVLKIVTACAIEANAIGSVRLYVGADTFYVESHIVELESLLLNNRFKKCSKPTETLETII